MCIPDPDEVKQLAHRYESLQEYRNAHVFIDGDRLVVVPLGCDWLACPLTDILGSFRPI